MLPFLWINIKKMNQNIEYNSEPKEERFCIAPNWAYGIAGLQVILAIANIALAVKNSNSSKLQLKNAPATGTNATEGTAGTASVPK